ncbi:DUF5988 family protein [Streptomyces sp. 7R007]
MSDFRVDSRDDGRGTIRVALEGGPSDIPSQMTLEHSVLDDGKVKVRYLGGYEHFELVDERSPAADDMPVFRWTMRTKVAE